MPNPIDEAIRKELQKALDQWRDVVFKDDIRGLNKDKSTQKIEKVESK